MPQYANVHGRKWGRGLRPWILMPKIIAVALMVGGLAATFVLTLCIGGMSLPLERQELLWQLVRAIFRYQVIPAAIATVFFGILLLLQHPMVFLRMRWLRVKLVLVALVIPYSHWRLSGLLASEYIVRELVQMAMVIALVGMLVIVVLGRLKPRLGQAFGRAEKLKS